MHPLQSVVWVPNEIKEPLSSKSDTRRSALVLYFLRLFSVSPNSGVDCLVGGTERIEGEGVGTGKSLHHRAGVGDGTRPSGATPTRPSASPWSRARKKPAPWNSDLISPAILPYRSLISSLPTGGRALCPSPSHLSSEGELDIDLFIQVHLGSSSAPPDPPPPRTHL